MKTRTNRKQAASLLPMLLLVAGGCYHVEAPEVPEHSWLADCAPEQLVEREVLVRCHIDGRSRLHIRGDELWLSHFDYAAPGRHEGANHPTIIDGDEWYPDWPFGSPPDEGRDCGGCETEDSWSLDEPLPRHDAMLVELDVLASRGETELIELPTAENDYELVVEWNDNPQGGSTWYETAIVWTVCGEPLQPLQATLKEVDAGS